MAKNRARLGLVLGSGSARGLSFIGVLKVFDEENIPIDYITGSSIGAIIGGMYASGIRAKDIEGIFLHLKLKRFLDFTVPSKGILSGDKIEERIREIIKNKKFNELYIPFSIVATDLVKGQRVIFEQGDVAHAIRASIAIPGIFTPVEMEDMILVDGGVTDPIPSDIVKKHVDKVIAIDLSTVIKDIRKKVKTKSSKFAKTFKKRLIDTEIKHLKEYLEQKRINIPLSLSMFLSPAFIFHFLKKRGKAEIDIISITRQSYSLLTNEFTRLKLENSNVDLIIKPNLEGIQWLEFDKAKQCIEAGERIARRHLKDIKRLIGRK